MNRIMTYCTLLLISFVWVTAACAKGDSGSKIIHDAEYYILEAQHGEKWAADDKSVDSKIAAFRKKNGGKPPNILYVLVDDLSFGEMGIPELNYVRGSKTPRINKVSALLTPSSQDIKSVP